jgi:hypothetical protein
MEADDIMEILYNELPTFAHTLIVLDNYKWFETAKTDSKVMTYFDRLLVIDSISRDEKENPMLRNTKTQKWQRTFPIGTSKNVVRTATTNCNVGLNRKPKMNYKEK